MNSVESCPVDVIAYWAGSGWNGGQKNVITELQNKYNHRILSNIWMTVDAIFIMCMVYKLLSTDIFIVCDGPAGIKQDLLINSWRYLGSYWFIPTVNRTDSVANK